MRSAPFEQFPASTNLQRRCGALGRSLLRKRKSEKTLVVDWDRLPLLRSGVGGSALRPLALPLPGDFMRPQNIVARSKRLCRPDRGERRESLVRSSLH